MPTFLLASAMAITSASEPPAEATPAPTATEAIQPPEPAAGDATAPQASSSKSLLPLPNWLHFSGQATAIVQSMPGFPSKYEGAHSLPARQQAQMSHSYTLYLGVRPVSWLEGFVNPEMIRGNGINGGQGLAGFTNGEVIRNPSVGKEPYIARAFARITIPLGGEEEQIDASDNQFGGKYAARRLTLTGGKMAASDVFDTNAYANSTRTQFMNWAFLNNTSYDFAADTRGYTVGGSAELTMDWWSLRAGIFAMPTTANGIDLAHNFSSSRGDQVELEFRPKLWDKQPKPTVIRLLAYHNESDAGRYSDALAAAGASIPDITAVRQERTGKYGFGVNIEQPIADDGDTGAFLRAGWNNGQTETYAYTEADAAWSAGVQLSGAHWSRPDDRIGLAFAQNFISGPHRAYLAAGGLGFQIGDGHLSAGPETIAELYYKLAVCSHAELTGDVQEVVDPAYNRDRGPLTVFSLRLHVFF